MINLPLSMQVFTDQFIQDIAARDLIDVVQFSSGITVGTGQATMATTRVSPSGAR